MATNGDSVIRDAMKNEHYEAFEEEHIFKQILGTVRGRNWWVGVVGFVLTFPFVIFFMYSVYKFFTIDELDSRVFWGITLLLMAMFVTQLKMWFFLQMNRNTLLRELKRMELQVAKLSERVGR